MSPPLLLRPHSAAVAEFWAGDRGGNGRRGSAMIPSCISARPAATLPPYCDAESVLRPQARVSAAAAPAHGSNPTTPAIGSRSRVIHRSRATSGMPFAEAWIGADRFVRFRTAFWVLFGSLDAACDVGAANLVVIRCQGPAEGRRTRGAVTRCGRTEPQGAAGFRAQNPLHGVGAVRSLRTGQAA